MNIPIYPHFRPILKSDKPIFDEAFRKQTPQISEFTFSNLYCWRDIYSLKVSHLDGSIIVHFDKENAPRFLNPIGGNVKSSIQKVLADFKSAFIRVPEETEQLFAKELTFKVTEDPANSDYLYKTADLINLTGRKYDGKRNLIKKFRSTHEYEYEKLDSRHAQECFKFIDKWCLLKDCEGVQGLNNEKVAFGEMIDNFSLLNLIAGAIKIKGNIAAVAIAERLNADTLVMHILKANPHIQGLYQAMNNEFLLREAAGFEFVNLEQDLGIEGLRKAKLSYHPVKMIKKFTLEPLSV